MTIPDRKRSCYTIGRINTYTANRGFQLRLILSVSRQRNSILRKPCIMARKSSPCTESTHRKISTDMSVSLRKILGWDQQMCKMSSARSGKNSATSAGPIPWPKQRQIRSWSLRPSEEKQPVLMRLQEPPKIRKLLARIHARAFREDFNSKNKSIKRIPGLEFLDEHGNSTC